MPIALDLLLTDALPSPARVINPAEGLKTFALIPGDDHKLAESERIPETDGRAVLGNPRSGSSSGAVTYGEAHHGDETA